MPNPKTILIVDDNENIYKSLSLNFSQRGCTCLWAKNGSEAQAIAASDTALSAVLLDLALGSEDGIEVMQDLLKIQSMLPIIIITGFGTFEAAVRAIKLGACDFLAKPLEFAKLYAAVQEAMNRNLSRMEKAGGDEVNLITRRREMLDLCKKARQFGRTDIPILITGESGTGKELLASLVHASSTRRERPFLRINCSAFADSLVDSELFGHEKGAFTGAVGAHPGLFEQADTGTLHLDEIGDMALATQAKILRALEEGVVRRIGGLQDIKIDVRIIASTNKNLEEQIERAAFRSDLFYRLNAVSLHIPPLRERKVDVPLLLEHFLHSLGGDGEAKSFSPEAVEVLSAYHWPGNIRELRNVVKVCAIVAESDVIEAEDLPDYVRSPAPATSGRLNTTEKETIQRTLAEAKGNKSLAAEKLGISRRTLYNKMDRYGIS